MFLNQDNNQNDLKQEYYCCPYCQREILQSNQQTHEARCQRMQHESQNILEPTLPRQTSQRTQNRQQQQMSVDPIINPPITRRQSSRRQNDNSQQDLIPCEFCDKLIKMDSYNEHAEQCQATSDQQQQQQQQQRQAHIQEREAPPQRRTHQRASSQRSQVAPPRQERASGRGFFEEGFPGEFFSFGSGSQNMMMGNRQQQQQQQRTQPRQPQNAGFFGLPFGNPMMNPEDAMEIEQPQEQGYYRTIESLPNGAVIVRTNVLPSGNQQQQQQQRQAQPQSTLGGVFGQLFQMFGGENGLLGQIQFGGGGGGMMPEQNNGLSKEIIDSLAVTKYNKKKNENLGSEAKSCPICLEDFQDGEDVKFLWCMHRFHAKCVDTWLEKNSTCPTCKKDFSEAERFGNESH